MYVLAVDKHHTAGKSGLQQRRALSFSLDGGTPWNLKIGNVCVCGGVWCGCVGVGVVAVVVVVL